MKVRIKCPDGEIKTPKECLKTGDKYLPEPIMKKVIGRLAKERKKKSRIRFGVTKIATKCLRQSFYQLTEEQILELDKLWILSRGHAFHNHFQFEKDEVFVQKKFKDFDVLGFIDGIQGTTMYELKTTSSIPSEPHGHHTLQLQSYYSMYPEKENIDRLRIVYLNLKTIKTFDIPKRNIMPWVESRGHQLVTALKTKTPPPKEKTWLCSFCPFKDICENHTVEKKESEKRKTKNTLNNKKERNKIETWKQMFNC